jgi:tetratricopeptide (TPR) repeat protein
LIALEGSRRVTLAGVTPLEETAAHWREWFDAGDLDAGAARVRDALAAPGADEPSIARVRVLYAAHLFAFRRGEPSRGFAQETLDLARELGDTRGECDGLTGLARAALREGDWDAVVERAAEGVGKARDAADPAAEVAPLHLHAAGVRLRGDYARARDLYRESLALADRLGNERVKQMEFHNLGWVELHLGDLDRAAQMFAERDARSGLDAYGDAWKDLNAAALAVARGDRADALALLQRGTKKLDELGAALDPDDQYELDWLARALDT